jgi:outer membrane protein/protease secretion system outer membrane protein
MEYRPDRLCACLLAVAMGLAHGAETPLSVFRAALEGNAGFRATRAGVEAEREAINIAFGALLPNLSIASARNRSQVDHSLAGSAPERFDYTSASDALNLRQPLYRPANLAAWDQAKARVEAAEADSRRARSELAVKTVSTYFDAALTEDVDHYLQAQKAAATAQVSAATRGLAAGSGTRIDIDEARSRLDLLLAQEIDLQNQRADARRTLGALMARPPQALARLAPERMETAPPFAAEAAPLVAEAIERNPELATARAQVAAAELEVRKATTGHHPTLDLVASASRSGNDSLATLNRAGDVQFRQNIIGLQLSIPLYAGGQVGAAVRQATARLEQARQQAEETRRQLEVTVQKEFDNLSQGMAKIRALERAVASAVQTAESVRKGVLAGVRSNLEVLTADQQVFQVRSDLARERYRYLLARLRLAAAIGRDMQEDLQTLSTWFAG